MATLITDAFTRADSAVSAGSPSVGGPYTARAGTWGISSNRLYNPSATANAHITFPAAIDADITVTIPTIASTASIILRWVDVNNYWMWAASTTPLLTMQHNTAGTFTVFGPQYVLPAPPYTIRFVGRGRYLYGYLGSTLIVSNEDPWYAAATSTAGLRIVSNAGTYFDDLSGVDSSALTDITGGVASPMNFPSAAQTRGAHILKGRDRKTLDTTSAA